MKMKTDTSMSVFIFIFMLTTVPVWSMICCTNHTKGVIFMEKAPAGKYAWTATVGEKGQIVIPKQARDIFDIKPGDTLILLGDVKRGIAIPPKSTMAAFGNHIFGGEKP